MSLINLKNLFKSKNVITCKSVISTKDVNLDTNDVLELYSIVSAIYLKGNTIKVRSKKIWDRCEKIINKLESSNNN